jgi:hypothetical protein
MPKYVSKKVREGRLRGSMVRVVDVHCVGLGRAPEVPADVPTDAIQVDLERYMLEQSSNALSLSPAVCTLQRWMLVHSRLLMSHAFSCRQRSAVPVLWRCMPTVIELPRGVTAVHRSTRAIVNAG